MTLKGKRKKALCMKYYTLETIYNGNTEKITKKFTSRNAAINYAFAYFEKRLYNTELQVEDEFVIDNDKHNIEYVLNYFDRFRVNRVVAAF